MWKLVKEYTSFDLWSFKGLYKECFRKGVNPNIDVKETMRYAGTKNL